MKKPMMDEKQIRPGCVRFVVDAEAYIAELIFPSADGPNLVAHENEWRLVKLVYHKSRYGFPLQVARKDQRPRDKRVGYFPDLESCRSAVLEEEEANEQET